MVILANSGREWADRTKGLNPQVLNLDIFSHGLVERISGKRQIPARGGQCSRSRSPRRCARTDLGPFTQGLKLR
jgi:hypothetical protein